MKIKEGAELSGLDVSMRHALIAADKIWTKAGEELVVTSGLDGKHSVGSLHYYGFALDFRTRYFDTATAKTVLGALRASLSEDYDVILHKSHIHVEYDPK